MPLLAVIAGILLMGGALVPGEVWIGLFRPMPLSPMREQLMLGTVLFRATLALIGLVLILAPRLPFWEATPAKPKDGPEPQSGAAMACILGLLVCAFALRLYKLELGLWYDEVLTYVGYARMPFGEILTTYNNENQHFVFTILAHACFLIFGEGAWALRLPAMLFGVASVGSLYLFARQVGSTKQALFAAALFTFSYHHIWFSQNARGYSGLLFWVLLSSWLLLRALREDRPVLWLAFAATVALGIYTHITMVFAIAGQAVVYLLSVWQRRNEKWPNRWAGLVLGFCGAGLITLFLHALVLPQIRTGMAHTVSVVQAWKNPLWTALEIFQGLKIGFAGITVAIAAMLVVAAGVWNFWRKEAAVVWLLLVPVLVGGGYVVAAGHHLWPRFFYFGFGFGVLVAIRGAMVTERTVFGWLGRAPVREAGLLCAGMVLVSAMSVPRAYGPKQDYEGAMAFVEAERQPGDSVLMAGLIAYPYQNLYKPSWQKVTTLEELNTVRASSKRTIVVYTLEPVLFSMQPEIAASVKREFRLLHKFPGTLENGAVYVYVADKPPLAADAR
ncbi:MAG: glycosyltransferase family 39 protein [Candidatus Solibacter sp.]